MYIFVCLQTFAYRFEFSSSSKHVPAHLAVCTGLYEEYEVKDLEEVGDDEKEKKKSLAAKASAKADKKKSGLDFTIQSTRPKRHFPHRVISSYVKMLRVEESQGKLRETKLLEELISLEEAMKSAAGIGENEAEGKADSTRPATPLNIPKHLLYNPRSIGYKRYIKGLQFWDSSILNQCTQRFKKSFFNRILKAEILLQNEVSKVKKMKEDMELKNMMQAGVSANVNAAGGKEGGKGVNMDLLSLLAPPSSMNSLTSPTNPPNEKELRLESSKKRYVQKKKALQQFFINQAYDMVGKKLVLWDDGGNAKATKAGGEGESKSSKSSKSTKGQGFVSDEGDEDDSMVVTSKRGGGRWRTIEVKGCEVKWKHTTPVILHSIQEYNEIYEPIGKITTINLSGYKTFPSPWGVLDGPLIARYKQNKAFDEQLVALQDKHQQDVRNLIASQKKYQIKIEKKFAKLVARTRNTFKVQVQELSERYLDTKAAHRRMKKLLSKVILDMKKGLIPLSDGGGPTAHSAFSSNIFTGDVYHNNNVLKQFAQVKVRDIVRQEFLAEQKALLDEELQRAEQQVQDRIVQRRERTAQAQQNLYKQYLTDREAILKEKREVYRYYMKDMQPKLKIPNFQRALPKVWHCEHLHSRAYGTTYTRGRRCVNCGAELGGEDGGGRGGEGGGDGGGGGLDRDESQVLGYGTGGDAEFNDKYTRFSSNERIYKFKDSAELQLLESEKIRLEKEERELEKNENFFYDLESIQAVYNFDILHKKELKEQGIFRQGVQWNEGELERYLDLKKQHYKAYLDSQHLPHSLLEEFDPLSTLPLPPPSIRQRNVQHTAYYQELLFQMRRVNAFQRKIVENKLVYMDRVDEAAMYRGVLEMLHRDAFIFEVSFPYN